MKLNGEEHETTLSKPYNYATFPSSTKRFEEARSLLRKMIPVARRVLGEGHEITLKMRWIYARALYMDKGHALDDHREAVATLKPANSWKRIFGPAHPETPKAQVALKRGARCAGRAPRGRRAPRDRDHSIAAPGPAIATTLPPRGHSPSCPAPFLRLELGGMLGLLRTVLISHLSHIRIRIISSSASVARRPVRRHVLEC